MSTNNPMKNGQCFEGGWEAFGGWIDGVWTVLCGQTAVGSVGWVDWGRLNGVLVDSFFFDSWILVLKCVSIGISHTFCKRRLDGVLVDAFFLLLILGNFFTTQMCVGYHLQFTYISLYR